jgi:hypothetical protein
MRNESRGCRRCAATAIALAIALWGCGSNSDVHVNSPNGCDGASGPQVTGIVQMPNGKVAQAPTWRERVSSIVWNAAAALNGDVRPVRGGVVVNLVQLRPEDLSSGREPGVITLGTTHTDGSFCIGLPPQTDANTCRFMVQVGNSAAGTLTRAFVFSTEDGIDIDFRSEATVRSILATIPPAGLCDFSPGEIRSIYDAVAGAPGTALGADADEINAVAASLAAQDPGVQDAIAAALGLPRTATATRPPASATPSSAASGTPESTSTVPAAEFTATAGTTTSPESSPTAEITATAPITATAESSVTPQVTGTAATSPTSARTTRTPTSTPMTTQPPTRTSTPRPAPSRPPPESTRTSTPG